MICRLQYRLSTYRSATSHSPQQTAINLNDLLDRLTRDPVPSRRSRIRGDYYAALESERECRGAVCDLDGAVGVGVVVGHCAEPCCGLIA